MESRHWRGDAGRLRVKDILSEAGVSVECWRNAENEALSGGGGAGAATREQLRETDEEQGTKVLWAKGGV